MAVAYWCGQEGADMASCEWLVPVRQMDLTGPLDLDRTAERGGELTAVLFRRSRDGGRRLAAQIERGRCGRGSWDAGKVPTGSSRGEETNCGHAVSWGA